MSSTTYNYAIIGAGAAGLHLVNAMVSDPWFSDKRILVLDKDPKAKNDRTWCFWEKGTGKWDDITHHQWETGYFIDQRQQISLQMKGYRYKMLRSIDFYDFGKTLIERMPQVTWRREEVTEVREGEPVEIRTEDGAYRAEYVFDSRIPQAFFRAEDDHLRLLQHFKGWVIKTREPIFDPKEFVMMDFRLLWEDSTSFTYVLPMREDEALIEFTFFTPDLINEEGYDEMLKKYIEQVMGISDYEVIESEKGIIPMSDFPFRKYHSPHIQKIGTAGGWVKPSSGYSFKFAEKFSAQIVDRLKQGLDPQQVGSWNRFNGYDTLFLDVLVNKNHLGPALFGSMYRNNRADKILRFLDEETTVWEEFQIINTFPWKPFIETLVKRVGR